ncbi:MAG: putative metal-binding motif-containing protein [Alphaproteobacteria bacterium]|nr:putative metal-binding motif-containing protein [Alphaproteobacteria bacterium]
MRKSIALLGLLGALAPACGDKDATSTDDSTTPADDTSSEGDDTGETQPPQDQDRDGHYDDEDCNDNDYSVFPGAPERCNGIDNDCDGAVDEDFDADGDGYLHALTCPDGDDCDDNDPDIHPGAEEIPYDDIDQDCDGADLLDADGDGFRGAEAGGNDCDDTDATVYPGAEDVALDGIDQDCDGEDNIDGDGDGYGDEAYGGDDCDDADPAINPGALDWSNDGLDTNCDGDDDTLHALRDATMTITGSGSFSDLVGRGLSLCDLDEDGLADLVVAAPFGSSSYPGYVGVWYGSSWSTWTAGMTMSDADTLIEGDTYGFIGFNAVCADFDGDGHDDIALERGEILYAALAIDTSFGVLFYYGDGQQLDASLGEGDADAELSLPFVVPDAGTVYSSPIATGDVDGDGATDLVLSYGTSAASTFDGEERVLVLPGDAYSGQVDMVDALTAILASDQPYELTEAQVLADLNGDGRADLALLSSSYTSDYTGDSADTGPFEYEGRAQFLTAVDGAGTADASDLRYASQVGTHNRMLYGLRIAEGDFDGDGVQDIVVSTLGEDDAGRANAGGLFFFSAGAADLTGDDLDPAATADAVVYGDTEYSYLGYRLKTVGDMDGDGCDDLLVAEPGGAISNVGVIYLVSGALLSGELDDLDDTTLLTWRGSSSDEFNGFDLAGGRDIDGDGIADVVIVAGGWDSANSSSYNSGKVYIYLSSEF